MGGEENNSNPTYTIWTLGELSPLLREILHSLGTYLKNKASVPAAVEKKKNQILFKIIRM